ncbi:hypothetical protein ACLK1T_03950 [Escherichia coli]
MLANEGPACSIGYGGDVNGILRGDYGAGFRLYHRSGRVFAMNSPMAVLAPQGRRMWSLLPRRW